MNSVQAIDMRASRRMSVPTSDAEQLYNVIDSIGTNAFPQDLLSFVDRVMGGVDHCALFSLQGKSPGKLGAATLDGLDLADRAMDIYLSGHWNSDPLMLQIRDVVAGEQPTIMRMDVDRLPPSGLRDLVYRRINVRERVMLSGWSGSRHIGISVLRSSARGAMSSRQLDWLIGMSSTLLAVVGKHAQLLASREDLSRSLGSVAEIAAVMAQAPENLPRREIEVCARILFGISSLGIGLDLDIGEETVKTYRKRAYQRLGIATQRELLMWYLRQYGEDRIQNISSRNIGFSLNS